MNDNGEFLRFFIILVVCMIPVGILMFKYLQGEWPFKR